MDFDWELVTIRKVYSRFRDRLALSKLVDQLEKSMEEIWGFVLYCDGKTIFSWDAREGKAKIHPPFGEGEFSIPEGKVFAYLLRTSSSFGDESILEFGVEPWLKARFDGKHLSTEVKQ
jgi:hypothetical protein